MRPESSRRIEIAEAQRNSLCVEILAKRTRAKCRDPGVRQAAGEVGVSNLAARLAKTRLGRQLMAAK
jgi:hypothetical protein